MPCDLATTQAAACLSGIGKVQNRIKLLQIIAQLTCEAAEAGGGGGGGGGGEAGSGSPEGVVTANPGTTYWDDVAKSLWVKDSGVGSTGWYNY